MALAACSGAGGGASKLPITTAPSTLSRTGLTTQSATTAATVTGTIVGLNTATQVNIDAPACGGYVNVNFTSSTVVTGNGYTLSSKGAPISVWGSGTCTTSFTATSIVLGISSTPTVTGTVVGLNSATQVNIDASSCGGYTNVNFTSSTPIVENGYTLSSKGAAISVWGSGSCQSGFTATQIVLGSSSSSGNSGSSGASTISQKHVLTADYLGGCCGTTSVSYSSAATVLSWAEVSSSDGNAISAAGIKTLDYVDPFRQATYSPLYSSDASTFALTCSGSRISIPYSSTVTMWLMNPSSADLRTKMNAWQSSEESVGHIDAFYYDDIDTLYGVPTLPCNTTQSSWDAANASFIATSSHPVVFSGYALSPDAANIIGLSSVLGATVEECYIGVSQPSPPYRTGTLWTQRENLQLAAAAHGKLFFCYNNGGEDGETSTALRKYVYASFLMTYSATSSVLWETFTTPSGLHVFPETKLVPTDPLVATPSSVSTLLKSTGVYAREYGACYLDGSNVGPCAAVVNSSLTASYAMPALSTTYAHTLAISGYGSLDGGTVATDGPAPPATVPAETGLILFK